MIKGKLVTIEKVKEYGHLIQFEQIKNINEYEIEGLKVIFCDYENAIIEITKILPSEDGVEGSKSERVCITNPKYLLVIDGNIYSNEPELDDIKKVLLEHFNTDMKFTNTELISKDNKILGVQLEEDTIIEEYNSKLGKHKVIVEKGSFVTYGINKIKQEDGTFKYVFGIKGVANDSKLTDCNKIEDFNLPINGELYERLLNAVCCPLEEADETVVAFVNEFSIVNDQKFLDYSNCIVTYNEYLELKNKI